MGYFDGGLVTVSVQLGRDELVIDPSSAVTSVFLVRDDSLFMGSPSDQYGAVVENGSATLGGTPVDLDVSVVSLGSSDTSIFGSDAMPAAQPSNPVSDWDRLDFLQVQGALGADIFLVEGTGIATPEPGTGALLGFGLFALALRSRGLAHRK